LFQSLTQLLLLLFLLNSEFIPAPIVNGSQKYNVSTHRKIKKHERDLRDARDEQPNARQARHLLAEALVDAIVAFPGEALEERLPQMLWAECFYKDVMMFRHKIRQARGKVSQKQSNIDQSTRAIARRGAQLRGTCLC
jgi:hypothetical protein